MSDSALSLEFLMATCSGIWLPTYCKSKVYKHFYRLYTLFTVIVVLLLQTVQLGALIFMTESMDDMVDAGYMFLTAFNACIKGANILCRRQRMIDMVNMLQREVCIPKNAEEVKLFLYFDKIQRFIVISCMGFAESVAFAMALEPLLLSSNFTLFLKAWYPYEINSHLTYWPSYLLQSIGLLLIAGWNTSNDVLITGMMTQTCAQLELMSHRIQMLPETVKAAIHRRVPEDIVKRYQRNVVRQSVRHHLHIYRFTELIKINFAPNISSQYCLSSSLICITMYQLLVNSSNTAQVVIMLGYASAMLIELLMYCWFGNEVSLKSLEFSRTICKTDWTELHVETLRGLLIMMLQTTTPIVITCGPFITLSVTSYTNVLKFTYSVFNVIQHTL